MSRDRGVLLWSLNTTLGVVRENTHRKEYIDSGRLCVRDGRRWTVHRHGEKRHKRRHPELWESLRSRDESLFYFSEEVDTKKFESREGRHVKYLSLVM